MTETIKYDHEDRPVVFTQDELGWAPWLEPLLEGELTDRHWAGLVDASRAQSEYFMLLAHDPVALRRLYVEGLAPLRRIGRGRA